MPSGNTATRTVLLVEDDAGLSSMISDGLWMRGYAVWRVGSASEAEEAVDGVDPDVVVLDLMLPDRNGLTLCSKLKQRVGTSVIICSATRHKDDAVIGLQLGADDFLRKPFSLEELEARIGLAMRRAHARRQVINHVGSLKIDVARCEAVVDGQLLRLTPTEFRLLSLVSSKTPDVVSKQYLAEHLWGTVDRGVMRSLDVHMRRLRAKLKGAGPELRLVTRRGFGYQLADGAASGVAAPR